MTEINMPGDLSSITIEQYLHIMNIYKKDIDDKSKNDMIIAYLTSLPLSEVRNLELKIYMQLISILNNLFNDKDLRISFKLNKVIYGLIPNLEKITTEEYLSIEKFLEEENWAGFISVIYRPIEIVQPAGFWRNVFNMKPKKAMGYKLIPYEEDENRIKEMLKAPAIILQGSLDFFLTLSQELLEYSTILIAKQMEKEDLSTEKKNLIKDLVDIAKFPIFQKKEVLE